MPTESSWAELPATVRRAGWRVILARRLWRTATVRERVDVFHPLPHGLGSPFREASRLDPFLSDAEIVAEPVAVLLRESVKTGWKRRMCGLVKLGKTVKFT